MAWHNRSFKEIFKTSLFKDFDKLCDAVVISEDGVEFKVHKLFLSKGSDYFNAFFRGRVGTVHDRVTLMFDSNTLEKVLIFLYVGDIYLTDDTIAELIRVADYLLIDALLMSCRDFVLNKISLDCCVALLSVSQLVGRLGISDTCFRFVEFHFERLVAERSQDIAQLTLQTVKDLIISDSLRVTGEHTVWEFIVIWVQGNDSERLRYVPELLLCLRWTCVEYFLASRIALHSIVNDNEFCKSIKLEELAGSHKESSSQPNIISGRFPRKTYVVICRKRIPSANGMEIASTGIEIFITYDGQLDMWRKIAETDSYFHIVATIGEFLFLFNTYSNRMTAFNLIDKTWHDRSNINLIRQAYFVIPGTNCIFAIGGFSLMYNDQPYEVECYDPIADLWSYCTSLPSVTVCGACVMKNKLYVVGYNDYSETFVMRAMAYDITHDCWSEIEKPKQFRTNFAIIHFLGCLYILGGHIEDRSITRRVEIYLPEENQWFDSEDLPFPYQQPHALILKDNLMVYDDCPGMMSLSRLSPCVWNGKHQTWQVVDIFSEFNEIHRYQFCCIDDRRILKELSEENADPKTHWKKTPFV